MYREVYVPVDNSDYSNQACVIGVDVARKFGGRIAGCHAYAAKMHDVRFRQMESGLPEEFRDEEEMKRQRKIHDQDHQRDRRDEVAYERDPLPRPQQQEPNVP